MITLQASFRTGSILAAWADLLQTGDAYSAAEKQDEGCSADCTGICAPFSVSQLLMH